MFIGEPRKKADYDRMLKNFETVRNLKDSKVRGGAVTITLIEDPVFPCSTNDVLEELARRFKGTIQVAK